MGFPSPAADYVHTSLNVNDICNITPSDTVLVTTEDGYVLLSKSQRPSQGDIVLIQFCGNSQSARIQGNAFITDDGEAIEGEALDDLVIIGKVTMTIVNVKQDHSPVI